MTLSSCGCKVPWALRGGCGSCGSLGHSRRYTVSSTAAWVPSSPHILCCTAATHSQGAISPWLTISRSADRPMGTGNAGECDGCDDCDGIFDTVPAVVLIVTTVTNRHASCFRSRMALPFLVRFTVYSTPYSLSNSPAFTLSCRVRIFGGIFSWSSAASSVALPFHSGATTVRIPAIFLRNGSGGFFQSSVSA